MTMHGNCWSGKILNGTTKKSTLTTDFSQMKKCNSIFKYFEQFYILISSNDISIFIPFDMHIQQLIYFRGCPCVRLFAMGCFYLWLCSSSWADVHSYIYSYVICMFFNFFSSSKWNHGSATDGTSLWMVMSQWVHFPVRVER